jgi:hypothetical protein
MLTCEFHIYKLNCATPLRYNAFIGHWVTACARIQRHAHEQPNELVPLQWKARLEIIRLALTSPGVQDGLAERGSENMETRSPKSILANVKKEKLQTIDLKPFVQMMVQQGLPITKALQPYLADTSDVPETSPRADPMDPTETTDITDIVDIADIADTADAVTSDPKTQPRTWAGLFQNGVHIAELSFSDADEGVQDAALLELLQRTTGAIRRPTSSISSEISTSSLEPHAREDAADTILVEEDTVITSKGKFPAPSFFPITPRSSILSVQQALKVEPDEASHALMRLPLDLPSLELFTKLLEGRALDVPGVDTATVVREYVQHCLRIIERLGATFSPASDTGDASFDDFEAIPTGREEQKRAVTLLTMFMKNLLRKGLLPVQELAFDLEEICIRYIWIAGVREFRKFLEGGDVLDSSQLAQAHGVGG